MVTFFGGYRAGGAVTFAGGVTERRRTCGVGAQYSILDYKLEARGSARCLLVWVGGVVYITLFAWVVRKYIRLCATRRSHAGILYALRFSCVLSSDVRGLYDLIVVRV